MSRARRSVGGLRGLGFLGVVAVALAPAPPAIASTAPYADTVSLQACSAVSDPTTPRTSPPVQTSLPLAELGLQRAAFYALETRGRPGDGVTVAVLDSGIARIPGVLRFNEAASHVFTHAKAGAAPTYYQGTAVAGLIAGAGQSTQSIGIAPGATLIDLQVYDSLSPGDGEEGVSSATIIGALERVLRLDREGQQVDLVNVSVGYDMTNDDHAAQLVRELWDKGTIVVAATGTRSSGTDGPLPYLAPDFATYRGSEDVADRVFPAGYPLVVGANATPEGDTAASSSSSDSESPSPTPVAPGAAESAPVDLPDPPGSVYASSATDVAVPTAGATSYAMNGDFCTLPGQDTAFAAAEVTGVLAMLKSFFPDASPAALVGRLEQTATGQSGGGSKFVGYGVVDPYAALTTPLVLDAQGAPVKLPDGPPPPEARVAPERPDPLGHTRSHMVWWAVGGGGAMALALLLTPVLSRRRPG